jgi:hypothetical protein
MSQLVLEHYVYNTLRAAIFSKTYGVETLDAHIRTIVVLTGDKLTVFCFLHLLYAIYYSVMMHRWSGKKVSILPLGDVNPESVPSR